MALTRAACTPGGAAALPRADTGVPTEPGAITDLSLERMHIRRLQQLSSLVSLKRARCATAATAAACSALLFLRSLCHCFPLVS